MDIANESRRSKIQIGCALVVLVLAFWHLAPVYRFMATSSLWQDEIYSVEVFSGHGWQKAVTDYSAPNNHIFFNLVNSLTPRTANPFLPGRARFWSFVAISSLLLLSFWQQVRQRQWLAGALAVWLVAINQELVQLGLQARGYGFTLLAGAITCWLVESYCRNPRRDRRAMWGLAFVTILGTYSIPTYIGFGGGLMLVLLLAYRDWRWIVTGIVTLAVTVLLYLPVMGQLQENAASYASQWGERYAGWSAVQATVGIYLFNDPRSSPFVLALFPVLLLALFLGRKKMGPQASAAMALIGATLIFLLLCLKIRTPLVRTTAFVVLPLIYSIVVVFQNAMELLSKTWLRTVLCLVSTVLIGLTTFKVASKRKFVPIENWKGSAEAILAHFRPGVEVWSFPPSRNHIGKYLSQDFPVVKTFDKEKFLAGQQVVLEARGNPRLDPTLPAGLIPPGTLVMKQPQSRSFQFLYYLPSALAEPTASRKP